MNSKPSPNERLQFAFLGFAVLALTSIFLLTPALRPASLLTILNVLFLGPTIKFLHRHKIPKIVGILGVYLILALIFVLGFTRLVQSLSEQWSSLIDSLPTFGAAAMGKLDQIEQKIQSTLNIEINLGLKNWLIQMGNNNRTWALTHLPSLLGDFVSAMLLAPIFSFFILKDGDKFRDHFQRLIPRSHAENTIHILDKIFASLGKFLRAKLVEALILFFLCFLGLKLIGAPYAFIFAIIAGVTNIIPYLGPILGIIPPALVLGFSQSTDLFWPMVIVFLVANAIDMILIFPVFVAKLVNLSPLTLLASVAVGQELYGIIGMLIAVPCASIAKIVLQEVMAILYP